MNLKLKNLCNIKKILVMAGMFFFCGVVFAFAKDEDRNFKISKNLDIFNALFKELNMVYVDTLNSDKIIKFGIDAMLSQADPYTEFYSEGDNTLKEMTTGKFGGIGAAIRYYDKKERIAIVEPVEGMPATQAGLKAGDIILSIDGRDMIKGKRGVVEFADYVKESLRGEPGTTLMLVVDRPIGNGKYQSKSFKLTRRTIQNPSVPFYGMINDKVGYIVLTEFTDNCAKDVKRALIELKQQGAQSLMLDLRGNGGGLLDQAVDIVNLFVPKGKDIVITKGKIKGAGNTYKTTKEPIDLEIPIAVLVDGATASAAEIVSGSLQDLDRAVIVGNRTFGKGLVQTLRPLPYNSSMKITTAKYYIPSGRCIQAIDYSKRTGDGTIERIPDSLTTVFHTAAGREVRDGGGIRPDIEVKEEKLPNILFYMINDNVIFDYATKFALEHPKIEKVDDFVITDTIYSDFKTFVKAQKFDYDRQSDNIMKKLKEVAEFEGYMKVASDEFAALEKKLSHNLDNDLDYFSKPIKQALGLEIVKRYYFNKGALKLRLKDDEGKDKALEVLGDKDKYNAVLSFNTKKSQK